MSGCQDVRRSGCVKRLRCQVFRMSGGQAQVVRMSGGHDVSGGNNDVRLSGFVVMSGDQDVRMSG